MSQGWAKIGGPGRLTRLNAIEMQMGLLYFHRIQRTSLPLPPAPCQELFSSSIVSHERGGGPVPEFRGEPATTDAFNVKEHQCNAPYRSSSSATDDSCIINPCPLRLVTPDTLNWPQFAPTLTPLCLEENKASVMLESFTCCCWG